LSEVRCRIVIDRPFLGNAFSHDTLIRCNLDSSASIDVTARWRQDTYDERECILDLFYLYPESMRGKGVGSQALFDLGVYMWKKGCRRFYGRAGQRSLDFWNNIGATIESLEPTRITGERPVSRVTYQRET